MGLTIHYEGHLENESAYGDLILMCRAFAEDEFWPTESISEPHKTIERIIANDDSDIEEEVILYEGPTKGVRLYPHPECEPFTLEFGIDLFCQDYTKTQFAGPSVHRKVIDLLTKIKYLFSDLKVDDESDYWDERSETNLDQSFERANEAITEALQQYPGGRYKVKTPDSRFIDIVT